MITKKHLEFMQELRGEIEDDGGARLSEWHVNFMDDQFKRMDEYGDTMFMSSKQWAQIEKAADIYDINFNDYGKVESDETTGEH